MATAGWTKLEIVTKALKDAGIIGEGEDGTDEELFDGMVSLDAMMGQWDMAGIHTDYPIPPRPEVGNLEDDSHLTTSMIEPVVANLAIRLAAVLGRQLLPAYTAMANQGYDRLRNKKKKPGRYRMPSGIPAGMGNRGTGRQFLRKDEDEDEISDGTGSTLEIK
jgi:hypothetical protein